MTKRFYYDADGLAPFGGSDTGYIGGFEVNLLTLGVVSTSPAVGSTVGSTPTHYIVNVSNPLDATTVAAGDFQVNGNPATGYSYTAGSTRHCKRSRANGFAPIWPTAAEWIT